MIAIIVGGGALCAAAGAPLTAATWPAATIRQVPTVSLAYIARTTSAAPPAGQGSGPRAISQASDSLALAGAKKDAAAQAGRKLTLLRFNSAHKAHIEHIKHIEHMKHMAHAAYIAYVAHEVHAELLAEQAQEARQAAAAQQAAAKAAAAQQAAAKAAAAQKAAAKKAAALRAAAAAKKAAALRAAAKKAAALRAAAAAKKTAALRAAAAAKKAGARKAAVRKAGAQKVAGKAAARRSAAAVLLAAARQQQSSTQSSSARSDSLTARKGSASSGSPQEIARQLLDADGQGSQFSCLVALWNRESGWNFHATNPTSGAYGIPQSLPAIKMARAGADWRTDAATQIRWGVSYIDSVYGSPCAAWSHEEAVGWY